MTEEEINDHFMDDLDVSAVPDVDINVNEVNGVAKEAERMDASVIEGTPKVNNKQKQRNAKSKSAKKEKAALDSSNYFSSK